MWSTQKCGLSSHLCSALYGVPSAAFGRSQNHYSRKKRNKAKKGEKQKQLASLSCLRLFSFLSAMVA